MQNKNRELGRKKLCEVVWGSSATKDTRVLSKHILVMAEDTLVWKTQKTDRYI